MLYREKVDNVLSQFNITNIKFNRMIHPVTFALENQEGISFSYIIEKPLYYILHRANSTIYPHTDSVLFLPTDLIDRYTYYLRVMPTSYDSNYLTKHKVIKTDDWYANEYWNQYTDEDIQELLNISGHSDLTVSAVFGKFIITSDNKLRFLFDPVSSIYDNVDLVYQSDLYLYPLNGRDHMVYYVIFRTLSGQKFLLYYSSLLNLISAGSSRIIPLVNYFTDLNNVMVVYNMYNLGIFENKVVGIKRLIVNAFKKSFFKQAFSNFKLNTDTYNYTTFYDADTPPSGFMPSDIPPNAKIINKELLGQSSLAFKEVEVDNAIGDIIFQIGELDISVMYYA